MFGSGLGSGLGSGVRKKCSEIAGILVVKFSWGYKEDSYGVQSFQLESNRQGNAPHIQFHKHSTAIFPMMEATLFFDIGSLWYKVSDILSRFSSTLHDRKSAIYGRKSTIYDRKWSETILYLSAALLAFNFILTALCNRQMVKIQLSLLEISFLISKFLTQKSTME